MNIIKKSADVVEEYGLDVDNLDDAIRGLVDIVEDVKQEVFYAKEELIGHVFTLHNENEYMREFIFRMIKSGLIDKKFLAKNEKLFIRGYCGLDEGKERYENALYWINKKGQR